MGLFDTLGDLLDIGKITVEFANKITEIVAQDVKNKMSVEPRKEICTSYNVRDETDKFI